MASFMASTRRVRLAMGELHKTLPPMIIGMILMVSVELLATDPPHNIATANSYGALNYCSTCHKVMGGATGGALTTVSGNVNLCLSCHVSGGSATNKAFAATDQAVPASASLVGSTAGGTSHRWDSGAQGRLIKGTPNTSTGTITPSGDYTGAYAATIQIQVTTGGVTGTAKIAWSQTTNGTATFGATTTLTTSTTAQALGTTGVSIACASTGTFVLNDIFYLYVRPDLVNPTSAMATHLEGGKAMCSTCHDQHLQALAPFDPLASQTYTAGTTNNRHFQRVANDTGSLCGDCHAPRNVGKGGSSHPVHVNLASAPNTKTPSASLVLSAGGNVECLSCHDVHKAPTATTPTGMLLRVSNSTALCTDCHTLADTTTANVHTNPTSGILWPGDGYGGSTYPAYTLAADRGACKNCHTPHGWPDANNPGLKYGYALGARQDNLCETCHDGNGPSTKDVRTQITKTIHHPVERISGRLVGCADCHNPHMAVAGVHTYATTADLNRNRIRTAAGANLIGALKGVDGVQFNYSGLGLWAAPTSANFTKIPGGSPTLAASGAEFEYQVCFKCHTSYDSYGATRPGGITTYYNAGTAKFTNGSTTVTGTGTTWTLVHGGHVHPEEYLLPGLPDRGLHLSHQPHPRQPLSWDDRRRGRRLYHHPAADGPGPGIQPGQHVRSSSRDGTEQLHRERGSQGTVGDPERPLEHQQGHPDHAVLRLPQHRRRLPGGPGAPRLRRAVHAARLRRGNTAHSQLAGREAAFRRPRRPQHHGLVPVLVQQLPPPADQHQRCPHQEQHPRGPLLLRVPRGDSPR